LTIVTSDRDVAEYAKRQESIVVSSEEFDDLLEMAAYAGMKGSDMEEEEETSGRVGAKKGPARRLSKEERKKKMRKNKL